MTDEERKELRQVRNDMEITKEKIHTIGTEIMDNNMKRAFLVHWKKARWIGVVIVGIIFIGFAACFFYYYQFVVDSTLDRYENVNGAMTFSLGTTLIVFAGILTVLSFVGLVVLSFKLYLEMGVGPVARKLAKTFHVKNYFTEMRLCSNADQLLQKSLLQLKREELELQKELNRLETIENPWEGTY